jgi:hypothetical protein
VGFGVHCKRSVNGHCLSFVSIVTYVLNEAS